MRELLLEIWTSVRRNKLRTFLTGFSVAWGIFMLVILLGSGNGLKNGVTSNFGNYATNSINLYGGRTSKPYMGNQKGRRIAAKIGSTGYLNAQNNLKNAAVTALPDESACVMEVATGTADGFIYDQLTIYRNWQKNPETTEAVFIPFQKVEPWGGAVRKGDAKLLNALNVVRGNDHFRKAADQISFVVQNGANGGITLRLHCRRCCSPY